MLAKIIYKLGAEKRNPSLFRHYNFLLESDNWSYEKLVAYQLKKCRELLEFAYKYSPFYKEEFDKINFNPSELLSINDIKKLPIIDKQTLIQHNNDIHTKYSFKKTVISETSGTSGQVLNFNKNEEWDSGTRAAMFRGYNWYGVKPWDRNGYFWGYNINKKQRLKTKILDILQNRFRIFSYNKKEIRKFIKKLKLASFISGYSSMIYEVAKIVNKLSIENEFNLKMVKGTSEKIYDNYQDEVKKAFGIKLVGEYGAAESGIIAYECPEGNMHICMENVVVEEINGEIVVTNLLSKSFPIIRYKLGDYIKLAPNDYKCKCGRSHPVLLDVLGRVGKNIYGNNNIYPSLSFYYVFKNLSSDKGVNLNYQAIQNEKGKILLKIEQNQPEHLSLLQNELKKYFNNDVEFDIKWNENFHHKNGKLKDFITTLN